MAKYIISLGIVFATIFSVQGSDLKVWSEIEMLHWGKPNAQLTARVHISWKNAWNNKKNHDAAWLFFKIGNNRNGETNWKQALVNADGHELISTNGPDVAFEVPDDRMGMFVYPKGTYKGDVELVVKVKLDVKSLERIQRYGWSARAHAIEMVYIPQGGFTLGDPDATAIAFNAFYQSDENGQPDGLIQISKENQEIPVGPNKGNLYYQVQTSEYQGDQKGPVPSTFPKGVDAFYVMKYETTQGQYAEFLNTLYASQTMFRINYGVKGYYKKRGTIQLEDGKYVAGSPNRPANLISWDDGLAFADWAGLRPMTEFEFTKAARGPSRPIKWEYPWGTNSKDKLARVVDLDDELKMINNMSEGELNDTNREVFGASYYWVMDLAGSVWERVVTIGHEKGRAYKGTHGDGRLTGEGNATNQDWPKGDTGSGGFGYRGGGYYEHFKPAGEFNPHSPIAFRRFGSWAGGNRSIAYSNRFVRTAPR
ncbi:MAG: SUMF1/EgtB/PvdO family nonheme iron enzyme [Bacteroidota bacterium]